jgi:hypothetical protein
MRVTGSQAFGRRGDLRLGVTSSELTYDERLEPGGTSRYRHRLWSVAGESMLRFPRYGPGTLDEIDIGLGAAFDRSTYPLSGGKPALGARNEWGGRAGVSALLLDGHVSLHASGSRRTLPVAARAVLGIAGPLRPQPGPAPRAAGGVRGRDHAAR